MTRGHIHCEQYVLLCSLTLQSILIRLTHFYWVLKCTPPPPRFPVPWLYLILLCGTTVWLWGQAYVLFCWHPFEGQGPYFSLWEVQVCCVQLNLLAWFFSLLVLLHVYSYMWQICSRVFFLSYNDSDVIINLMSRWGLLALCFTC